MSEQGEIQHLRTENEALKKRVKELEGWHEAALKARVFLMTHGFQRCNDPTCNCGSWHQDPKVRAKETT